MFLGLCLLALSGYGVFTYCMHQGDGHHNHYGAERSPSSHHDYKVDRHTREHFPTSPDHPELKHNPTTSVVTPRNAKDVHHFSGVPAITSQDSDVDDHAPITIIDSHNITTTIAKTVVVKTKIKCGDCFPKDCKIM